MPFGLLLQGGDQLYADEVVRQHPGLRAWHRCRTSHKHHHAFTETMREAAARFYVERYLTLYGQPGIADLVARVPSLMMWADHDIIEIGRASWRERLCTYGKISVVAVLLKKT